MGALSETTMYFGLLAKNGGSKLQYDRSKDLVKRLLLAKEHILPKLDAIKRDPSEYMFSNIESTFKSIKSGSVKDIA